MAYSLGAFDGFASTNAASWSVPTKISWWCFVLEPIEQASGRLLVCEMIETAVGM